MSLLKLLSLIMLPLALFALTACGGTPSAAQVLKDVTQALEGIESYRFDARFQVEQTNADGPQQGEMTMSGDFATPNRIQMELDGDDFLTPGGARELIFDGDQVYQRSDGGNWSAGLTSSQFGLLNVTPGPWEIANWLGETVLNETAEVSQTELDGETVMHVRGNWAQQQMGKPFSGRQDGTLEVWIGAEDHLLRQATYTVSMVIPIPPWSGESSEARTEYTGEVSFSDYNTDIQIEAP